VGDANNVARSLAEVCSMSGVELVLACPDEYCFAAEELARWPGVSHVVDPREAVRGAQIVYTDVWVSMGKEAEAAERIRLLTGYQINESLVRLARPDALVMHCLPAYRGKEIDADTFEANAQTIFDQAENRLHVQKAILEWTVS
jgi:ornithine carbamoyltransferase